jgi:hypothetical protein
VSLRVYAVVPGATRVPGRSLHLVTVGRLAAVVERGRARAATPRNLVAYDRQMRMLADRAAAILPARFNTIVADEEEVATILRLRRARLAATLKNVRGRVQMTVRVPTPPVGRAVSGSATGTEYLRSRRIPELDPLRAATKRWVRDERVEPRAGLASIYHLVPGTAVGAYREALIGAADAAGVRLVVTGPFPPYAFAQGW